MGCTLKVGRDCIKCSQASVFGSTIEPKITCRSTDYTCYNLYKSDGRTCAAYCKGYKPLKNGEKNRLGEIKCSDILSKLEFGKEDNIEIILHSTKTNQDFTYRIKRKEKTGKSSSNNKYVYFVSIQQGHEFEFAGTLWKDTNIPEYNITTGDKSTIAHDSVETRSLLFVLNKVLRGEQVQFCEVYEIRH